jgi:AraC-like DNA-binding protein
MTYEKFTSSLPANNRVSFASAEETQEVMDNLGVNQQMKQLGKGCFKADMSARATKGVALFADRFNKGLSISLTPPAENIGLLIPRVARESFIASGSTMSTGKLLVVHEGIGTDIVSSDFMGSESLCVSKSRFNELAEILCPSMKLKEMTFSIKGDTAQLLALRNGILELMNQQAEPDDEQLSNLISSFILWLDKSISNSAVKRNLYDIGEKARTARLAQEYIHENYHGEVRIEDICRETGVGVRTLQRSFREYFDLTLTEYLNAARLNAAHRDLSAVPSPQVTVAEIALRNGCKHLGRFSVGFRKQFGLSPNEMIDIK